MVEYKCKVNSPEHGIQIIEAWSKIGYKISNFILESIKRKKVNYLYTNSSGIIEWGELKSTYDNFGNYKEFKLNNTIPLW